MATWVRKMALDVLVLSADKVCVGGLNLTWGQELVSLTAFPTSECCSDRSRQSLNLESRHFPPETLPSLCKPVMVWVSTEKEDSSTSSFFRNECSRWGTGGSQLHGEGEKANRLLSQLSWWQTVSSSHRKTLGKKEKHMLYHYPSQGVRELGVESWRNSPRVCYFWDCLGRGDFRGLDKIP